MTRKKLIWVGVSLAIAILSIWAITSQSKNFSPELMITLLKDANKFWLFMAFLCTFGFIWFEGYAIIRVSKRLGYTFSKRNGTLFGAADVYFSAITPSASGGQPASAYFMLSDGMSGPAVTTTLLLNLIMYSLSLFLLVFPSIILGRSIFFQFTLISKLLIGFGCIVLLLLMIVFYFLLFKAKFLYGICNRMLKFLERIHLVRHGKERREKLNKTMHDYQICSQTIAGNKWMLIEAFLLNFLQRLSQLAVSCMVFLAMGKSLKDSLLAMLLQCFVALGSNSVPIPGGMGVADYIMLDGMEHLVGAAQSANIELLCRGITYYGCVLLGGTITLIGYCLRLRKERKKASAKNKSH